MPNIELLDAAIDTIAKDPRSWNQDSWRCDSGMCVAGWAVTLNGDRWATDVDSPYADFVIVPRTEVSGVQGLHYYTNAEARAFTDLPPLPAEFVYQRAEYRARHLLGITNEEGGQLFDGGNDLERITLVRDAIVTDDWTLVDKFDNA